VKAARTLTAFGLSVSRRITLEPEISHGQGYRKNPRGRRFTWPGLAHALAPELSLRPVLVEIGASCPWPGLYLLDSEIEGSPLLEAWLQRQRSTPSFAAVAR